MHLEPIAGWSADEWNEAITPFDTAMFYHHAAWLSFLEETGRGTVERYALTDDGRVVGYFAALLVEKGPFRILGSPPSASMSEYMGPIVNDEFDARAFLVALDELCRARRIHQVEIGSPLFPPELMAPHGFSGSEWMTFRIALSSDEGAMWSALKGKCRNRIRKGIKNGLRVEDSDDPSIVDVHYEQMSDIFGRQRLAPPFSRTDFRALFDRLKPHDLLFALKVTHEESGDIVASGVFPHDGRRVYSLSTASGLHTRDLYPNELLHWSVMKMAGQRGLQQYSIGDNYRIPDSGGRFKDKFNGTYESVHRFLRHYSALAKYSRQWYTAYKRVRQRIAGRRDSRKR